MPVFSSSDEMMIVTNASAGPPEGLTDCHCTNLRKASRQISQLYDEALAGSGLRTTQRSILAQLARSEPTTVRQLADAMVIDPSAMAHTLKPLQRDGLVAIAVDPADRRNRQVSLTPAGRTKLDETEAAWCTAQARFETAFGAPEAERLRSALRLLVSNRFSAAFEQR
jgi:DNA-binding MarR family transcriptional regulator